MNQMGEAQWAELSEKQRQQKLMEIKMKERQLRDEGKLDEARELINHLLKSEQGEHMRTRSFSRCLNFYLKAEYSLVYGWLLFKNKKNSILKPFACTHGIFV